LRAVSPDRSGAEPGRVLAGFEQREVLVDLAELEDALYVLRSWDEKQPPLLGYFVSRSSHKWASYGIRGAGNWLNSPTRSW